MDRQISHQGHSQSFRVLPASGLLASPGDLPPNGGVVALSLDTWVSLAALAGSFSLLFGYLRSERTERRRDMAQLRAAFTSDFTGLRTEIKSDVADLRTELKTEVGDLRRNVATLEERICDLNTSVTALLAPEEVRPAADFPTSRSRHASPSRSRNGLRFTTGSASGSPLSHRAPTCG